MEVLFRNAPFGSVSSSCKGPVSSGYSANIAVSGCLRLCPCNERKASAPLAALLAESSRTGIHPCALHGLGNHGMGKLASGRLVPVASAERQCVPGICFPRDVPSRLYVEDMRDPVTAVMHVATLKDRVHRSVGTTLPHPKGDTFQRAFEGVRDAARHERLRFPSADAFGVAELHRR